jgi:hypothetical protein
MVRMAPSCDGAPLPGRSALPRRKRITSPHGGLSMPYSFSTSAATVSSTAIALAGSLNPRGVVERTGVVGRHLEAADVVERRAGGES